MNHNPPYPREWAETISARAGSCPDIAGVYLNAGEMHLESGVSCPAEPMGGDRPQGTWGCHLTLGDNLGVPGAAASVSLSQPDADALSVALIDEAGAPGERAELRRGRDFECDGSGLFFADTRSLLGGIGVTAVGVLLLTAGVGHHSRSFARNGEGELVMTVRESATLYRIFFGFTGSRSAHVRWRPLPSRIPGGRGDG